MIGAEVLSWPEAFQNVAYAVMGLAIAYFLLARE